MLKPFDPLREIVDPTNEFLDRPLQITAVLLTKARVRTMQAEAAALRSDHDRATSGPPTLQVINSFALLPADRSEQRTIGGHRMKSVLALMVATALVPRNYSLEEIARLVSDEDPGDVIDLEAARNNLYVRLHALRKILPPGAIASETGEAPRIDREHLRVDLLDILARATESVDAVGAGRVVAGLELITAVLDDLGTGIPFPSLYRPLFEAARDQVDVTIRRAVLRVAEGAAALDDFLGAAALLDRAAGRFAGDDEIFERRADMLRRGGRGLEAELG